jgi:hypothetical protein
MAFRKTAEWQAERIPYHSSHRYHPHLGRRKNWHRMDDPKIVRPNNPAISEIFVSAVDVLGSKHYLPTPVV